MTTFYRDAEVSVSSEGLRIAGHAWPLAALRRVWHARGPRSWRTIAHRGMLGVTILIPLAVGLLGATVGLVLHAPLWVIGVCVLIGLAGVPVADLVLDRVDRSYDRGSRLLEIWATTPSGDVLLLRTADAARFGRIYRALQRALEPSRIDR